MGYRDLREWLERVDRLGQLRRIEGAHWDLEASAVCSVAQGHVLFDNFPGYPPGYRLLAKGMDRGGFLETFFMTVNWSTDAQGMELTKAWRDRLRQFKPVPPVEVGTGPILENVQTGDDVDLFRFPVPRGYVLDGGRYIGTHHTVITRDPDDGRVNLGTYRMQAHDRASAGINFSAGKDGRIIMDKYHAQGQPCPVVAVVGLDPGLYMASTVHLVHAVDGASELDFAGWVKDHPEEVIQGRLTGLPIPAHAEIALEGEVYPGDRKLEGPFTEWTGLSETLELPVMRVKAVYHRNDPILTVALGREVRPPATAGMRTDFQTAALIWDQMERAGIRGIKGVAAYTRRLLIISIKNSYPGHSRQAGLLASQCHAGAYSGAYVIVVDDDVDPQDLSQVLWAVMMRAEPKRAIQILEYCWASHTTLGDPCYLRETSYGVDPLKQTYISKAIIDACRPCEWDPTWHGEIRISDELKKQALEKWGDLLQQESGTRYGGVV